MIAGLCFRQILVPIFAVHDSQIVTSLFLFLGTTQEVLQSRRRLDVLDADVDTLGQKISADVLVHAHGQYCRGAPCERHRVP